MPKLTEAQRRTIKEELLKGQKTIQDITTEYGLTKRQAQLYAKELKIENPKGRPRKEKETINFEEKETLTINEEDTPLPSLTEQTTPDTTLPEEGNFCANCYNQGKITELKDNQTICSECGVNLKW